MYILIIEDRHSDTSAHPFTMKETAIANAKHIAKKYARQESDYEEQEIDGWDFYATYSCEGDCVRVEKQPVDKWID